MSAIFVSHSQRDAAVACEVRDWLVAHGHRSLFLDFDPELGIPAGCSWEAELYRRLQACRAVIVLCSHASMASRWCFAEVTQARSLGKALFPMRLDDCCIDAPLADHQVIDLRHDRVGGFERLRRGLVRAGVDPAGIFDWDGSRPPYPGLLAFQEADAAVFFGRGDEIAAGIELLNRRARLQTTGMVVAVGASGSGKSSLVRAGLLPRLRGDGSRWLIVGPVRPRTEPVAELAAAWSRAFGHVGAPRAAAAMAASLGVSLPPPGAANPLVALSNELRRAAGQPDATVLVVVDQFEELLGASAGEAPGMIRMLRAAAEAPHGPLVVLVTLRSDFFGVFQVHPALRDLRTDLLPVGPMSAGDVAEVIEGPAGVAGLKLGPGLASAMVADADTDDGLPLLAFALGELYERFGDDGQLDLGEYRRLGGLDAALAGAADELVATVDLSAPEEDQLRRALLAMVRITDDERWVRQVAGWDDLPPAIHPLLERFVTARLLVAAGGLHGRTIEVAHEALFRSWDRLAGWLRDDADTMRLRRDLHRAAAAWDIGGKDAADLWRGARLGGAVELDQAGDLRLAVVDRAFLDAGLAAQHAELEAAERSRRRRLQIAFAVAAGALLLAGVAIAFFVRARSEEARAARQARESTALALASQARSLAPENPALGLLLAAESSRTTTTPRPEACDALLLARQEFANRGGQQVGEPLVGHTREVTAVAFSPDGRVLASASRDRTVRLWDASTGEPIGDPLRGHDDTVWSVAFSPDGRLLASASQDDTVRLWDPATGRSVGRALEGGEDSVHDVAFSPDGLVLASASGREVQLWNPATGELVGEPIRHEDTVYAVVFSPDGRRLASASANGKVQVWDATTGAPIGEPRTGHTSWARDVAFSPDGHLLASAGLDETVRLWDGVTGDPIGEPLSGHSDGIDGVAFSPDGAQLATASDDGTVRLWDPATGDPVRTPLAGHRGDVLDVAFSPTRHVLASASVDRTVRLWDLTPGPQFSTTLSPHGTDVRAIAFSPDGHLLAGANLDGTVQLWDPASQDAVGSLVDVGDGGLLDVAFSPDGELLASGSNDGSVRLWDPDTGQPAGVPLPGHDDSVQAVAFSPDGTLLASASADETARLWDVATRVQVGDQLRPHSGWVTGVAFNPAGTVVVTASDDSALRLWDTSSGERIGELLDGHDESIEAVAFSPDGDLLASAGFDSTVRLWDPATGDQVGEPLVGHNGQVAAVAFSPDGTVLASGGFDGSVRLWDPATGTPIGPRLTGHASWVEDLAFSPDGRRLASASSDGTVRLWDASMWDIAMACQLAAPYVTDEQVEAYLPPAQRASACG